MKYLIALICIGAALLAYSALSFKRKVRVSRELVQKAVPYALAGPEHGGVAVLVLGDSTAVGVGADKPEDTLAALLAREVHATSVDNFAVSGARVRDLAAQVSQIKRGKYAYILIGIGANDVIRFGNAEETAGHLAVILKGLPAHDKMVIYMAGNVGATSLFPRIIRPEYTNRTMDFHDAFSAAIPSAGGVYVNLYTDPATDPFTKEPEKYLASDGLHPSSAGYALWFEKIRTVL